MKKGLVFLIMLFSLIITSCGDDNDDSSKKIQQIEKDIVGIWVPNPKSNASPSEIVPLVLYFNKDKTGSIHQIISVTNGYYELTEIENFKNIRFEENTSGQTFNLYYEKTDNGKGAAYRVYYLSPDSLSIQLSTVGAFKKIPSIQIKE